MKNSTKTLAIAGATVALLSVGAVTYAATTDGFGPFGDHGMRGNGMMDGNGRTVANGNGNGRTGGMMNGQGGGMNGQSGGMMSGQGWTVPAGTGGTLDQAEKDALLHMVEEEKLAHDVYVTLGDKWDVVAFDRIATSETQHEAALATLLDRYGVTDPTAGNGVGEFTDPAFDTLYDQLVAKGTASQDAALAVGQQIEQLDIDDLQARLDDTDRSDITQVFQHLQTGSQHHLQAFTNLRTNGTDGTCDPQHDGSGRMNGMGNGRNGSQGQGRQSGN